VSLRITLEIPSSLTPEQREASANALSEMGFKSVPVIPLTKFAERESSEESIHAARGWCDSLALPDFVLSAPKEEETLGAGYFYDQRGASVGTIFAFFMRYPENTCRLTEEVSWSEDCMDFARCQPLLIKVPEWRDRITELEVLSKKWAALARNWEVIEAAHIAENRILVNQLIKDFLAAAPQI
jgi:hypothetical protein